mmetsp:Transcript_30732/g.68934  ORF Transcript_30732/g.68934 Transcript_30732/m.68934 type:complete len:1031 (-) Transcript_30732:250-3342(-)
MKAAHVLLLLFTGQSLGFVPTRRVSSALTLHPGRRFSISLAASQVDAKSLFESLDLDKDGLIDFTEFCKALEKSQQVLQQVTAAELEEAGSDSYTAPLVNDIELLTKILGDVIRNEDPEIFELYEQFKAKSLTRAGSSSTDESALDWMVAKVKDLSPEDALGLVRAFTQTLNLINAAEVTHRLRLLRASDVARGHVGPLPMREDSACGTLEALLAEGGLSKDAVYAALLDQKVDIVLTAHPTEVNRRTLLRKYRMISELLAELDSPSLAPYERVQTEEALRREVARVWGADEIRRVKPTPQQEANGGLAIVETVLWDAVPAYARKLDAQCKLSLERQLPIDLVPIKFSSWMGGDRDGNPNVTPEVTYEIALKQRLKAAELLLEDLKLLYQEGSVTKDFSPEMLKLAATVKDSSDERELYRRVIGHLQRRLKATLLWCEKQLAALEATPNSLDLAGVPKQASAAGLAESGEAPPIFDAAELLGPLKVMHESLCAGPYAQVADGALADTIRRVSAFGLTLVPLDLRQESTRHLLAIDAITQHLSLGSYKEWDEDKKVAWLAGELASKRPLFRIRDLDSMGFDADTMNTLRTIDVASKLGPGALGAYVISMARGASDVLAVMLLQKQFGLTAESGRMMRVAPLFETLTDLTNSASVMETLFALPGYVEMIKGEAEVMVGYSDSAKDAGRIAACWAQYESQEKMVQVAAKYGVKLTFFHGKGGTVGRGGNPALYRAVLAHPPETINGKFRVTEQGEMITQNFGSAGIAERTLDIYTAAVLAEKFHKHVEPKPEWRETMAAMSKVSCDDYRAAIQDANFIRYFRTATPELELGSLNIGSRPAKRNPKGGIESLRAIPWQFAWTQTRLHLPAWLGVGEGLDSADAAMLQEMYREWPFFREIIDLIGMTLSKTDLSISTNYETQLARETGADKDEALHKVGKGIRERLVSTRAAVMKCTGCDDLYSGFELLKRSMSVRNPYVDPLNVLQAETMKRLRVGTLAGGDFSAAKAKQSRATLEDGFVVSVNGIAQGMKNSG